MKSYIIKSISDVVTNSSSEVFCYIKGNEEILEEIYNTLGNDFLQDCAGDGGLFLSDDYINVSIGHQGWLEGLDKILKPGLEKLLEPWQGKYTIEYV